MRYIKDNFLFNRFTYLKLNFFFYNESPSYNTYEVNISQKKNIHYILYCFI